MRALVQVKAVVYALGDVDCDLIVRSIQLLCDVNRILNGGILCGAVRRDIQLVCGLRLRDRQITVHHLVSLCQIGKHDAVARHIFRNNRLRQIAHTGDLCCCVIAHAAARAESESPAAEQDTQMIVHLRNRRKADSDGLFLIRSRAGHLRVLGHEELPCFIEVPDAEPCRRVSAQTDGEAVDSAHSGINRIRVDQNHLGRAVPIFRGCKRKVLTNHVAG